MVDKPKNLHKPIRREINGHDCMFLTIGYIAHVLGRTTWTIKHWEKIGLFPPAPFIQHADVPRTRRRLYPEAFVEQLDEIVKRGYVGQRMDRDDWRRFHREVRSAYEATVTPLRHPRVGVTESSTDRSGGRPQAQDAPQGTR